MQLHELQRQLCSTLLGEFDPKLDECIESNDISAAERLCIYRNTIAGTLANALRLNFPAVERIVGAEFFGECAAGYVREAPPQSAYLNDFGAGFAEYLAGEQRAASLSYLSDVARLEWAVSRALVAEAPPAPDWSDLAQLDAALQTGVCFIAHPSVTLLALDSPVDLIWQAVLAKDDEALARLDPGPASVHLLVERLGSDLSVRRLPAPEWAFARALCSGQSLGSVLAAHPDVDGGGQLALHLAAGRLSGWRAGSQPAFDDSP